MNRVLWRGLWRQWIGRALQGWGRLSGDPQALAAGHRSLQAGTRLERLGRAQLESRRQIADIRRRHRDWTHLSGRR